VTGRRTPISPPLVKSADLLCPVVESRRHPVVRNNVRPTAFSLSVPSSFPAQAHHHHAGVDPTPIEAHASHREARRSWDPRGLETHSGPRTGLLMTSDVAHARPLSPGSGEGRRLQGTSLRRRKRAGVPSNALAAGPMAHDRRLGALGGARVLGDRRELGPVARVRRLAHLLPSRYAARNFSIEKTVPRDSM